MKVSDLFMTEEAILRAPMHEMANFYPRQTGMSLVLWLGEVGGQHGPRIKVSNTPGKFNKHDNFVVTVSKNPYVKTPKSVKVSQDQVNDVIDWIKLNHDILMNLWNMHETGDGDAASEELKLRKL
jgi:hypothetical protein